MNESTRGEKIRIDEYAPDVAMTEKTANVDQARFEHRQSCDAHGGTAGFLDELAGKLPPDEMRTLAETLFRVADAMDRNWRPETVRSVFRRPSAAYLVEGNSLMLARRARSIQLFRRERTKFLPPDLVGEPAWDMLLELFCQFFDGAAVSTKSLTIASGVPQTTALRFIERLEADGLLARRQSSTDRRVTLVKLTKEGVHAVGKALQCAAVP